MMGHSGISARHLRGLGLAVSFLAAAALACSWLPFGLGGQTDSASRIATLEAELRAAKATGTAAVAQATEAPAPGGPPPSSSGPGSPVDERFDSTTQAFQLGDSVQVSDGALLLGPYKSCANDVANFDQPVDCISVCLTCGDQLSTYHLSTTFRFEDGLSDREFGVVLRFVDHNGDSMIDREDYLLALGFNIYDNRWRLYLHEPNQTEPWKMVGNGEAGFLIATRMNTIDVSATDGGRKMVVQLNGSVITRLTADQPVPGERLVPSWADSGQVGLLVLGRGVQARFDDFVVEPLE